MKISLLNRIDMFDLSDPELVCVFMTTFFETHPKDLAYK